MAPTRRRRYVTRSSSSKINPYSAITGVSLPFMASQVIGGALCCISLVVKSKLDLIAIVAYAAPVVRALVLFLSRPVAHTCSPQAIDVCTIVAVIVLRPIIRRRQTKLAMITVTEKALTVRTIPGMNASMKGSYKSTELDSPSLGDDLESGKLPRRPLKRQPTIESLTEWIEIVEEQKTRGPPKPIRCVLASDSYLSFDSGTDSTEGHYERGNQ